MLGRVARVLNVASHGVEVLTYGSPETEDPASVARRQVVVPMPLSTQGHLCNDGRFYVANLARLFPADAPLPGTVQSLTHRLRPEAVASWSRPLSSDAFAGVPPLSVADASGNDAEVCSASRKVFTESVAAFARELDVLGFLPEDSGAFTARMHRHGINARYLGAIARACSMPFARELCEVEMVARACKHLLFRALRARVRRTAGELSARGGADLDWMYTQRSSRPSDGAASHSAAVRTDAT